MIIESKVVAGSCTRSNKGCYHHQQQQQQTRENKGMCCAFLPSFLPNWMVKEGRGGRQREKKGTRNSCLRKQMLCCSSSVRDQFEREVHLPIKIYSTASQQAAKQPAKHSSRPWNFFYVPFGKREEKERRKAAWINISATHALLLPLLLLCAWQEE